MNTIESLFSLKGKIALITGGYRGLGFGIAQGLAEAGATVVLNGRSSDGVKKSVATLREKGFEAHPAVFDINDEKAINASIKNVREEVGVIDILVNNAGIHKRNMLLDMPLEDWKAVIDTDLTSAFIVSKAVVPAMIEKGAGKVINICSLMSDLARNTTGNYAAAKGGLRMLTRAMTCEWASKNIQINGIAPGYFETDMTQILKDNPEFDKWICGRTPSARWGQPDELKGLAIFLASKASDYINGQLVYIDGGLTAIV